MTTSLLRVPKTKLEVYLQDSSILENNIYDENEVREDFYLINIDKSWDGIVFLLTGESTQNAFDYHLTRIFFSWQIIDDNQDLGYGPAHYLTPEEVIELNNEIAAISIEDLKQKYDPEKMAEQDVYPQIWQDDSFDYLAHYFQKVQQFYADAAKNGEAVVTFLN